tara:strand:- start:1775 stop:3034 length:1260 start_codon:yes stop_codon:yes gene_type:complete
MRWLFALALFVTPAMGEEVTTANVSPDMSAFTATGSTQPGSGCSTGQFCTGNASNGGGTYTSSFDVPLTQAEIQRGFTLNHSVDVNSHPSNATLATCGSITQVGDCRDIFRTTVALFDITNNVVQKFERQIELDFGGTRTFSFSDEIPVNSYTILKGELELFGIDAGFHAGAFGPQFSTPGITFAYQDVVEQQVLEQVAQMDSQIAFTPPPLITEIAAPSPPPPTAQPVETVAAAYSEPAAPPPPPVVAQIQTTQPEVQEQQQQQEAQVEAAIETEMEAQPETQQETTPTEQQTEAEPEAAPEPQETAEAEAEPQQVAPAAAAKPETKQEKQKAAAERLVKKIAPSQRYSAAGQATTMVVMNMLAGKIATSVVIEDTQGFFLKASVPDGPSMVDKMTNYRVFGASNGLHNALTESQWRK